MPFLPLAPALVAAVHDAVGVWFDELPLTPERVLRGVKNQPGGRYGNLTYVTVTDAGAGVDRRVIKQRPNTEQSHDPQPR